MKLYIKGFSSYRSDIDEVEIKKVLKQKYKYDPRRQDAFIHLGVYGAMLLKDKIGIASDDELFVTTGIGNIEVVEKTMVKLEKEKESIKLFDFLNSVGNTTSYYIASSLNLKGKNIFQTSDNFSYINTLISTYASISNSAKNAIISTIDFATSTNNIASRLLGVDESCEIVSSVNYQKVSLESDGAIAELEFDTLSYSLEDVESMLKSCDMKIMVSPRCSTLEYEKDLNFFENIASYAVNSALTKSEDLIFVDCFEDRYKILKLKSLK